MLVRLDKMSSFSYHPSRSCLSPYLLQENLNTAIGFLDLSLLWTPFAPIVYGAQEAPCHILFYSSNYLSLTTQQLMMSVTRCWYKEKPKPKEIKSPRIESQFFAIWDPEHLTCQGTRSGASAHLCLSPQKPMKSLTGQSEGAFYNTESCLSANCAGVEGVRE